MSWLARSIANSLKLDTEDVEEEDDDDDEQYPVNKNTNVSTNKKHEQQVDEDNSSQSPGRGIKEDLSEISKTLTRQFWGIASFIAPTLPAGHSDERSEPFDPKAISGIRRDFAEIGGRFRCGISKLSNNIDVPGISKLASDFLQLESEDYDSTDGDDDCAVGVTDDVVAFASDVAMHPETWLDFPLPDDEDDDGDFDLSDAQQEHAFAIQRLAPRLSALRIELCPNYMSESSFWKIYFVLMHPRLECKAAEFLSTPNIVKARALLTHESKNRSYSENMSDSKSKTLPVDVSATESVKHPIKSDDVQIVDKSVIQEESHEGKDADDWLKEESPEIIVSRVAIPIESNEDVSFTDLDDDDDDDDGNIPIHYKNATYASDSSTKGSGGCVQLNQSSTDRKDNDLSAQVSVQTLKRKNLMIGFDVIDIDEA